MGRFGDRLTATVHDLATGIRSLSPRRQIRHDPEHESSSVPSGRSSRMSFKDHAKGIAPGLDDDPSDPVAGPSLAPSLTTDSSLRPPANRLSSDITNGFKAALSALKECIDDVPAPGLKTAVGGILAIIQICENVSWNDKDSSDLISHITEFTDRLKKFNITRSPESHSPELEIRMQQLETDLQSVQNELSQIQDSNKLRRVANHEAFKAAIVKLNSAFDRIVAEFNAGGIMAAESYAKQAATGVSNLSQQLDTGVREVNSGIEKLESVQQGLQQRLDKDGIKRLLDDLPRADAQYDSGSRMDVRECFPETRSAILSKVRSWIDDDGPNSRPIFWLCGEAGVGKTTVAYTIAEDQAKSGRLGATFFFSRANEATQRPSIFIPTIALQLAEFIGTKLKRHLAEALNSAPSISTTAVQKQLPILIVKPLNACGLKSTSTVVIIIDALDECGSVELARSIIKTWAAEVCDVHLRLRVLITSRPDAYIRAEISRTTTLTERFEFHDIADYVVTDEVRRYLRSELQDIATERGLAVHPWPPEAKLERLVRRAGVLWIVAATFVKYIGDDIADCPESQLQNILARSTDGIAASPNREIDRLYLQVLDDLMKQDLGPDAPAALRRVLAALVALKEPMTFTTFADFCDVPPKGLQQILARLTSVIRVPQSDDDVTPVRVFHASFPEFLLDLNRSGSQFHIAGEVANSLLAIRSLRIFGALNYRDINKDSHLSNVLMSPGMKHSSLYLSDYICSASPTGNQELLDAVESFFADSLHIWIALNEKRGDKIEDRRSNVIRWYQRTQKPSQMTFATLTDPWKAAAVDLFGTLPQDLIEAYPSSSQIELYNHEFAELDTDHFKCPAALLGETSNRLVEAQVVRKLEIGPGVSYIQQLRHLKMLGRMLTTWAKLRHPQLLSLTAVKVDPQNAVAQLLLSNEPFRTLSEYLHEEQLSRDQRLSIALDIAKGLLYLHELSPPYVHCDFGPWDVRVSATGEVKLSPFSLPKFVDFSEEYLDFGLYSGSRYLYTPPEFFSGREPSQAGDVWAWSCVCVELITGRQPWWRVIPKQNQMIRLLQMFNMTRLPANLEQISLLVPLKIAKLLRVCWHYKPEKRPSMRQCVEQLQDVLSSLALGTDPNGGLEDDEVEWIKDEYDDIMEADLD